MDLTWYRDYYDRADRQWQRNGESQVKLRLRVYQLRKRIDVHIQHRNCRCLSRLVTEGALQSVYLVVILVIG